jgi:hypothetical protein
MGFHPRHFWCRRLGSLPDLIDFLGCERLDPTNELLAALARINSSILTCKAKLSRFCEFWIKNTIRNVTTLDSGLRPAFE